MRDEECALAMEAFQLAWQYTPMPDVQRRQFQRLFAGYPTTAVRDVLDDLIRIGASRPGPAEMGEMLRTKLGHGPAGARVRRYGPSLDDDGWREGMVPANEPGWMEAAAEARRRLNAPTEAEKAEAQAAIAQRVATSEASSKPDWWGIDADAESTQEVLL
jgi:hypothetical protein